MQLSFPASTIVPQTSCTDVTAVADGRLENEENISLTLESLDPDITTGITAVTSLIIEDTSSECILVSQIMCDHCIAIYTGIEVSLRESSYSVMEGQPVVVCADIEMGISDIPVVLSISSTQDTAQGSVET